jgi:hypothetical protein
LSSTTNLRRWPRAVTGPKVPASACRQGRFTLGFLKFSAKSPFTGFYHSIAGTWWADALFMIGLAAIALIGGIGMRIAAVAGAVLYVMMWSVALPPETTSSWMTTCSSRRFWSVWP